MRPALAITGLLALTARCAPDVETVSALLGVEVTGCAVVAHGDACEVFPNSTLTVWRTDGKTGALTAKLGEGTSLGQSSGAGGWSLSLPSLPSAETTLHLASAEGARKTLRLVLGKTLPVVEDARTLRKAGKPAEATALLKQALSGVTGTSRAQVQSLLGRLAISQGYHDEAEKAFSESIALHASAGRYSDAADDAFALSFAQINLRYAFSKARETLTQAKPWAQMSIEGNVRSAFYRGWLARVTGDVREALRLYRQAAEQAERFGLIRLENNARQEFSLLMFRLGRYAEGVEQLETVRARIPADATACEKSDFAVNLAWGALLEREGLTPQAQAQTPPAGPLLVQAWKELEKGCDYPWKRANVRLNQMLDALQQKDVSAAGQIWEASAPEREADSEELGLWWLEAEGRWALLEKRFEDALARFSQEAQRASSLGDVEVQWRAETGKARAFEALSQPEKALRSFQKAEALLDALNAGVPLGEGNESFLGERESSARGYMELLLRRGKASEALAVGRHARARALSALARRTRLERLSSEQKAQWETALSQYRQERARLNAEAKDDWKLSASKLSGVLAARQKKIAEARRLLDAAFAALGTSSGTLATPTPTHRLPKEVLLLAYFHLDSGWVGFAATGNTGKSVRAQRFDLPNDFHRPDVVARAVLSPFSVEMSQAERIQVMASGELGSVDFHALPWKDQPLVEHAAVEYWVDAPSKGLSDTAENEAGDHALMVADPRGDLPHARQEADMLKAVMAPPERTTVITGALATHARVFEALERAERFHYAGHGEFAGTGGFESALPLAEDSALTVGDILSLARAPRRVVLSGCETAKSVTTGVSLGLGLAQAFVLAGASSVVAATRPISDELAQQLSLALYASGAEADAAALRRAQQQLRKDSPHSDWAAFRIMVP